jgi:uncharacterized membrane protein YfcA
LGIFGLITYLFGLIRSFFSKSRNPIVFPILVGVLLSANFESWLTASLNPYTIVLMFMVTTFFICTPDKKKKVKSEKQPNLIPTSIEN